MHSALNRKPARVQIMEKLTEVHESSRFDWGDGMMTTLKIDHSKWQCTLCDRWQEYVVINGAVVIGCGGSAVIIGGNSIDCCLSCHDEATRILKAAVK